jgi:predicted Zn-dependent protease with MMP-like domain
MRADGPPWHVAAVGDVRSIWDEASYRQNVLGDIRTSAAPVPDNGAVLEMTREEFEELVGEALDRIPPELMSLLDNVAVFVEEEPDPSVPGLLGQYEGMPLTERGEWYAGVLPDRITVYRGPTLRMCGTREEAAAEVTVTVIHEIAHHFGIDDERLHVLGYG